MIETYKNHPLAGNELKNPYKADIPNITLEDKSIAIFTIGPVQSFISAAKKTKEFWAGSYLLSYLTWQALEVVIDKSNKKEESIIFPLVKEQPFYTKSKNNKKEDIDSLELPTLPNRFMAILDNEKAKKILKQCEKVVKEELKNILKDESIKIKGPKEIKDIKKQLNELLEVYWVVLPLEKNEEAEIERYKNFKGITDEFQLKSQYSLATLFAEELLGSRKTLRGFNFVEEEGFKCFICGERSGLIQLRYKDDKNKACAICTLKRRFIDYFNKEILEIENEEKGLYYPSVVEIAAMDYKEKLVDSLDEDELQSLLTTFKLDFPNYKDNHEIPLLNRWKDRNNREIEVLKLDSRCFDLDGDRLQNAENIKKLLRRLNKKYELKLNKYYALIYMDGDDMGKWVSGEKVESDQEMSSQLHSLVSQALTNYSLKFVKKVVEGEGRRGKVLYAGGDDVVAFVNLGDLFDVMRELRAYFSGNVVDGEVDWINSDGIIREGGKEIFTLGPKATVSLGACIAYWKEPLSFVIKKAQEMEKKAKKNITSDDRRKDAFAIGLLKHSGGIRQATAKWTYDEESDKTIKQKVDVIEEGIKPLIKIIRDNKFSKSFLYELKEEMELLEGVKARKIIDQEIKRLIERKTNDINKEELNDIENVLKVLQLIYYNRYYTEKNKEIDNVENFISLLEIIFFVGRRGE